MAVALPKTDRAERKDAFDLRRIDWPTILPFALASIGLGVLAWPVLRFWYYEYTAPESYYQHALLVPAIVGLMLWHRRDVLRAAPKVPFWPALALLVPALGLLVFAEKLPAESLESFALLLTIVGSVWLAGGTRLLRAAAFPLAFTWLMAPLPRPLLNDGTQGMQMASTDLADKILHAMTFHTALVGNVIRLDDYSLFVDVPCSGFKLFLSLLTFSAAFAYLVDGAPLKRFGLFLFGLPLSLVVNSVRVALIGVVGECVGPDAAHVFHDWSGMITLVLGFAALFGLAKGLGCRTFAGWAIF